MIHDLDPIIKPDPDFYREYFQRADFPLKDSTDFKNYEWYQRFVERHRNTYDGITQTLANNGASSEQILEAQKRYREVLIRFLRPTPFPSHEDPRTPQSSRAEQAPGSLFPSGKDARR